MAAEVGAGPLGARRGVAIGATSALCVGPSRDLLVEKTERSAQAATNESPMNIALSTAHLINRSILSKISTALYVLESVNHEGGSKKRAAQINQRNTERDSD